MSLQVSSAVIAFSLALCAPAIAQQAKVLRQAAQTEVSSLAAEPATATQAGSLPLDRAERAHGSAAALRAQLQEAVGSVLQPDAPAQTEAAMQAAAAMMTRLHTDIEERQVVLVVDRAPGVQRMWVTLALPGGALEAAGMVKVSTGKPGRKEHFRTPVGVFDNDGAVLGYRALGTYNENHIRGVGAAGMRVWDFGWQTTDDWRFRDSTGSMAIRMEMHATDPAVLEPRLGRWDSEGCIRIPSRFNSYLDQAGLIDAKLRDAARDDRRVAALLPRNAHPSPLAGHLLVIVDTSDPAAAPSDPVRANALSHMGTQTPEHADAQ